MRIGLISDTHIPQTLPRLPEEVDRHFAHVDRILHAGDLVNLDVVKGLSRIAPTIAVAGNMDPPEVRRQLPTREVIELGGATIGLCHGHLAHSFQDQYIHCGYDDPAFGLFFDHLLSQFPKAGIIVFGHFHRPVVRQWKGVLFINPGSIAPPHRWPTLALLDIPEHRGARPAAEIHSL